MGVQDSQGGGLRLPSAVKQTCLLPFSMASETVVALLKKTSQSVITIKLIEKRLRLYPALSCKPVYLFIPFYLSPPILYISLSA